MIETSCIIEHLQAHHRGPNAWIPDGELSRRVRFLDRFFDLHRASPGVPSGVGCWHPAGWKVSRSRACTSSRGNEEPTT